MAVNASSTAEARAYVARQQAVRRSNMQSCKGADDKSQLAGRLPVLPGLQDSLVHAPGVAEASKNLFSWQAKGGLTAGCKAVSIGSAEAARHLACKSARSVQPPAHTRLLVADINQGSDASEIAAAGKADTVSSCDLAELKPSMPAEAEATAILAPSLPLVDKHELRRGIISPDKHRLDFVTRSVAECQISRVASSCSGRSSGSDESKEREELNLTGKAGEQEPQVLQVDKRHHLDSSGLHIAATLAQQEHTVAVPFHTQADDDPRHDNCTPFKELQAGEQQAELLHSASLTSAESALPLKPEANTAAADSGSKQTLTRPSRIPATSSCTVTARKPALLPCQYNVRYAELSLHIPLIAQRRRYGFGTVRQSVTRLPKLFDHTALTELSQQNEPVTSHRQLNVLTGISGDPCQGDPYLYSTQTTSDTVDDMLDESMLQPMLPGQAQADPPVLLGKAQADLPSKSCWRPAPQSARLCWDPGWCTKLQYWWTKCADCTADFLRTIKKMMTRCCW